MTTISIAFQKLYPKCAFVPFVVAGDPSLQLTRKALYLLAAEGANIIEIGIPYSDPLADGPVIQEASSRALKTGIRFDEILRMVKEVSSELRVPLVAFAYYNLILNRSINQFTENISRAGFVGLIVPDLPLEEIEILENRCIQVGIELILLVGPNSSEERIRKIAKKAQGCIYLVSSTGVTGMTLNLTDNIKEMVKKIKQLTNKALILGFGISEQQDVKLAKSWGVNGIVIGSAIVKRLPKNSNDMNLEALQNFCQHITQVL